MAKREDCHSLLILSLQTWNGSVLNAGPCAGSSQPWMECLGIGSSLQLRTAWMSGGCSFWPSRRPCCCPSFVGGKSANFPEVAVKTSCSCWAWTRCFLRWLPESARWLAANGEAEAAHQYLVQCAEMNNRAKSMEAVTSNVCFSLLYLLIVLVSRNQRNLLPLNYCLFCFLVSVCWTLYKLKEKIRSIPLWIFSRLQK